MEHVIEIKNLTKHYGKNRGVEDITFSVRKGIPRAQRSREIHHDPVHAGLFAL